MNFRNIRIAAVALASLASTASAQEYSTDRYVINMDSEGGCTMTGDYMLPGNITAVFLSVKIYPNDAIILKFFSLEWSRPAADVAKYIGLIFFNGTRGGPIFSFTAAPTGSAVGDGEVPGMVTEVPAEERSAFLSALSGSSAVRVMTSDLIGDDDLVVALDANLAGSSLAVSRLRRCAADVKRLIAAQRENEARTAHIERDPFRPTN
jgi:hypothetical protein